MKKNLLLITILMTQLAFAQVVDVFNYTGALNANGWTTHSGTGGQMIPLTTPSTSGNSLSFTGLAASTGNRASLIAGNNEDLNKALTGIADTGYFSLIINVPNTTGMTTAGDHFFGFGGAAGTTMTSLFARLYIKVGTTSSFFSLGIANSGASPSYSTTEYAVGTPIFVVVKYNAFSSPTVASLFVNPTPGAAMPATPTAVNSTATTTYPGFNSLYIRQGGTAVSGTGNIEIDEIRSGSTYASVTPAGVASCNILSAGLTALTCNDAGTTSIPADDYLTLSLNPTGTVLGTTYAVTVSSGTVTPTTGTYGAATSFQLQAGSAGAGNVTLTITDNSTSGCSLDETITDPGACSSATPLITLAPATLTGFDHIVGTPSTEQTFTASGLGLSADITLSAPSNFEISLTSGTGFTNSIILPHTAGTVTATTIYARANAASSGALDANIIATSTGAINDSVHVSGIAEWYTAYTIGEVSTVDANGIADSLDVLVNLVGVVHCIDFDGNAGYSITLIDNNNDGINLFKFANVSGYTDPFEGDSIEVFGKIAQFNGLLEVEADSIILLSTGANTQVPTVVTTLNESTESQYIKMMNLSLVTPIATFATGSSNVDVTDGTNTFVMRIDSDTDIPGAAAPQGLFSVTGVGGQFDNTMPYDSGYQIFPCSLASIEDACTMPSNATTITDSATAMATDTTSGIAYQWINCATNATISGAINQSFTAITTGSYAVIVSNGACVDTSDCVALAGSNVGVNELSILNSIEVYPNPVNDFLVINNKSNSAVVFEIVDVHGKVILSSNYAVQTTSISTSNWEKGVYFVRFSASTGKSVVKVIK